MHRINNARLRIKRIIKARYGRLTFNNSAADEWVAVIAGVATTYRAVVYNSTLRVVTARAGTRVRTNLIHARFILRTIRTSYTFRMTIRRVAEVTRQTGAHRVPVHGPALTVLSTGRYHARVFRDNQIDLARYVSNQILKRRTRSDSGKYTTLTWIEFDFIAR